MVGGNIELLTKKMTSKPNGTLTPEQLQRIRIALKRRGKL